MSEHAALRPWKIYLLLALLCLLCVPWWVTEANNFTILGYPAWALYALGMSLLFAGGIITIIGRFWERLEVRHESGHSAADDNSGNPKDAGDRNVT